MRSVAHLIPDGPEGRRVPVPIGGGVELARDGERRGVAGGFPHPVPVRRRLLSRCRCRRLLHLYSFAGADDGRTDGCTDWCRRRRRSLGEARERDGARRVACTPILTAFLGARFLFLLLVPSGSAHTPSGVPTCSRCFGNLHGSYTLNGSMNLVNLPGYVETGVLQSRGKRKRS
jgi:hypothetical protein